MKRLQFCLAVLAVLALTYSAFAQVQNGQFTGTVTDPSGAAIPNAKVTVTNLGTNLSVATTTNQTGNFIATDFENGHGTVVNGLREDFNGFLINGVSNKGLSGGNVNTPIQDTVQEFQQLEFNMSAQYGNSAGPINNLVTKSGTNQFHGSLWEYFRNDTLDANQYF